MSSKSLAKTYHFLPNDEEREQIIRGFMAEHLTVVDQFSAELDMMSSRFTHSLRKYIFMTQLMDEADAKIDEINAFCDAVYPKPSAKTENASLE